MGSHNKMLYKNKQRATLDIRIENLTLPQAMSIEEMLAQWMILGKIGSSRKVSFYVDGDGDFHPHILINGREPEVGPTPVGRWNGDQYDIDFDDLEWIMSGKKS